MGKITTRPTVFSAVNLGLVLLFIFGASIMSYGQQGNYLLGPNDLVEVTVFQEEDLATKARVGNDGTITVPLVGSVKIGGKSVDDAAQIIRTRLAKGYLVNPQVNVSVTEFAKRLVTVIGQVQKGGTFEFPNQGPLDLLQAIGLAGGYSKIANPKKIWIKRRVNGEEKVYQVDGQAMAAKVGGKIFEILPGDTVTVAESPF